MKTLTSFALAIMFVFGSFSVARAAGLSKTPYKGMTTKQVALRGGAYFLTKNTPVRNALGEMNRRRVITKGKVKTSPTGVSTTYTVRARKYMPGAGPAEVKVSVRTMKDGTMKFYSGNGAGKVVVKANPSSGSLGSFADGL